MDADTYRNFQFMMITLSVSLKKRSNMVGGIYIWNIHFKIIEDENFKYFVFCCIQNFGPEYISVCLENLKFEETAWVNLPRITRKEIS